MPTIIMRNEKDMELIDFSEKDTVVVLNPAVARELERKGIRHVKPDFSLAEQKAIDWMKEWPDRALNGKSFKELFVCDGMSMWWLMENWLYYGPIWPLKPILETIVALKPVIEKTNGEIIFVDDGSAAGEVIKFLAGNRARSIKSRKAYPKLGAASMRMFFDMSFAIRKLAWAVLSRIYRPQKGGAGALFFSVYDWEILRKDGRIVRQDTYIAPLLNHLDKNKIKIIGIPVGRFLGIRNIKDKMLSGLKFNVLENYRYDRQEFNEMLNSMKEKWKSLKKEEKFVASFEFCGVNVWKIISRQFDAYFFGRLKSHMRDYMLLKSLLMKERPVVAVYPAETSEFGRELFYLCRHLGIKSLAIQHGIFGNRLNIYHTKRELVGKYRCPMPDRTAVYGTGFRDILVDKCNYSKNSVVVTGVQRFDRISEKGADIRVQLGIGKDKKIITLITSPVSRHENEELTTAVFNTVKDFADVQLVVKIHPNESDATYQYTKRRLQSNAIIVRDVDLYDVIKSSAAAMTYLSTAGMEVIMVGKPLIVVNLSGRQDRVPYVKEKAAIGVYRKEDIKDAIEKVLEQDLGNLRKQMERFVTKYAYKNDGQSAKRLAGIIKNMSRRSMP